MSGPVEQFFERLSRIDGAVISDISGGVRRDVAGEDSADVLDRLASLLRANGIVSGDRIVAVFDNTLETALTLLFAMRHGVTLCLKPAGTAADELQEVRNDIDAKSIVNASRQPVEGVMSIQFDDILDTEVHRPDFLSEYHPFTITFTSGSTGKPKGIVHCAETFLACARAFNRQTGISKDDRFLNVMPMYYMAGIFNGLIAPLASGAATVIDDAFGTTTAMRFWATIETEGISAVWLSPTMLSLVTRLDRSEKKVPKPMRRLFVGTGAMSAQDAIQFYETYGLVPQQSYGLSEILYVSVDDARSPNFGSVGCVLDGVELTNGSDQPLSIQTPFAFLGYLAGSQIQPHTGAFQTTDLAEISDDNVLTITGRSDDVILRGGVNINPVDIESAIKPVLNGRVFCVVGLSDPILGQKVALVTEEKELDATAFAEAQQLVRSNAGRAQLDVHTHVATFPVGPTGKIRRSELRSLLEGRLKV